ncbi:MAG: NAD(+)/NADH kinase [Desulfotomaculaceae bacterium]
MLSIGMYVSLKNDNAKSAALDIISWLQDRGCTVLLNEEGARGIGKGSLACPANDLVSKPQILMVLGGDGTLLSCARATAQGGTPILGVNMGRLGFLTEVDFPEIFDSLKAVLRGDYSIEERMMLEASVVRNEKVIDRATALNDVVITKGSFARIIVFTVKVDGEFMGMFRADGMIIASPTGSTAYSLSAGGPLVVPNLELMILTPICPHTLSARPMVIPRESTVELEVVSQQEQTMLTADGQHGFNLQKNDRIYITRSPFPAKFIQVKRRSFYEVLRKKLKESD